MFRALVFASGLVASSAATVYNPPNAGVALDALEKALSNVINSPHLSKAQLVQAKKVSADIEKTVSELETAEGKKLSKEARGAKVSAAIKELQGMQADWQKAADAKIADRKADLMKKLKEKQAELIKDQKMLKVINLEKALAEKKLALQKLIEQKQNKANDKARQEAEKEAAAQLEQVSNILKIAKDMKAKPAKAEDAKKVKDAATYLETRAHAVSDSLAKMDAEEKKREDEVKSAVSKKMPVQDQNDALAKSQDILKMLLKKEHRAYEKSRAGLANQLKELHEAAQSLKKGDAEGLAKVMSHMQSEMKTAQAKSHKFLY